MYPGYMNNRIAGIARGLCLIKKGKNIDLSFPDATPEEFEKARKLMEAVEADFEQ
jgi:hypothetical protein